MFENLPSYVPYIQFFSQIALVFGATFAGYQLLLTRRDRQERLTLDILTRLQDDSFRRSYSRIWNLPINATPEEVLEGGYELDAHEIAMTFENIGIMVHNRMVDIEAVDQMVGGFLRESWRRLGTYFEHLRILRGNRRIAEWFQWLAEHLAVENRRSRGAYEVFREWKP